MMSDKVCHKCRAEDNAKPEGQAEYLHVPNTFVEGVGLYGIDGAGNVWKVDPSSFMGLASGSGAQRQT
jgi:hypothetical protein